MQNETAIKNEIPTPFPYINDILDSGEAVKEGLASKDELVRMFDYFDSYVEKIRKDITSYKEKEGYQEDNEKLSFYLDKLVEEGSKIKSYFQTDDMKMLEDGLNGILSSTLEMHKIMAKVSKGIVETGPTKFPALNKLFMIGNAVIDNRVSPDVLSDAIDKFDDSIQPTRVEIEKTLQQLEIEEKEKLENFLEDFNLAEESIDEIREFFIDNDKEHIILGLKQLEKSIEVLYDYFKKAEDPPRFCLSCGHINTNEVEFCVSCGNRLPETMQEKITSLDFATDDKGQLKKSDYVMTANMKMVIDAVENVRQNKISPEEFIAVVDKMEALVKEGEEKKEKFITKTAQTLFASEEEKQVYDGAMALLAEGFKQIKEGLATLRVYLETQTPYQLDQGLVPFMEGCQKLYQFEEIAKAS